MRESFIALGELYAGLKFEVTVEGNPCGDCFSCCSALEMGVHKVSALELDYLEQMAGREKTDLFRAYIAREVGEDGRLVHERCPNHNGSFCTVHEYRPYSCRVYGMVRTDAQKLVPHCVFRESVQVIPAESERELLPKHRALAELRVDYLLRYGSEVKLTELSEPSPDSDPRTLGIYYLSQGDFERAVSSFESADRTTFKGIDYWSIGQAYQGVGRYRESLECYDLAVQMEPKNPTYHFDLASCYFSLGDWEKAVAGFQVAIELHPGRSSAHGMLGVCLLCQGKLDEGRAALEASLEREKEPSVFRFQLAQLYQHLGLQQKANEMYQRALECPLTQRDAQQALDS